MLRRHSLSSKLVTPLNPDWDAFVARHPDAHILQTRGWGALKQRFGWQEQRVAPARDRGTVGRATGATSSVGEDCPAGSRTYGGSDLVAGAQILFRRAYGLTLGYVPRGPLTDWTDAALTGQLVQALDDVCRHVGAAVLKVEPDLLDTAANRALLRDLGFRPSSQTIQPRSTIVLDISDDEDEILARMKSKWRYNIRLAKRKEVTVREAGAADLDAFNALMTTTGERDGFGVHSAAYYRAAYELLAPEHAVFLLAEYEEQPLAAIVVCVAGDTAWYLWGASSNRERNRMPNHALQWAGIRWAKAQGATRYDLWGIPDEVGVVAAGLSDGAPVPALDLPIDLNQLPGHDLWGVYRLKQGFGGDVVRTVGAWDRPVDALGFGLYQGSLELRGRSQQLVRSARNRQTARRAEQEMLANLQTADDAPTWRASLAELPDPHVLQSWEWGDLKAQTGWQAERYLLPDGDAVFQFLWRQPVPALPLRVGYVPKGPLVDWHNRRQVEATLDAVEAVARRLGCIFVKIDPDVVENSVEGRELRAMLARRGWLFSAEQIQFKNTAVTDLTVGEDQLLADMKSKWRYNIRLATRRGIQVRTGDEGDLAAFYRLYTETGARDGFVVRPFDYYAATWRAYLRTQADASNPAGGALLLAEHGDEREPVAALFLMRYANRSWYFYGASSERRRRDMPNYLLQWEALRWSIAQGCTVYDWWGAPTDLADEADGMQGVWRFKRGFGAQFRGQIGAWDYVVSPPLYRLYTEAMPRFLDFLRGRG